jgi:hypothetical protein
MGNERQIFVGAKFEKFEKKVFSIPAFFFGGMYFAYRKMLLYAIIISIITTLTDAIAIQCLKIGLAIIEVICVRIVIGLYFPIWYRKYYNKQVSNILSKKSDKSDEEKIKALQKKGGTSIFFIILFIIINTILTNAFYKTMADIKEDNSLKTKPTTSYTSNNQDADYDEDEEDDDENEVSSNSSSSNSENVLNDVKVQRYSGFNGTYTIIFEDDDTEYIAKGNIGKLLALLYNYDEITVNVYYTEKDDERTITDCDLYNSETNEKINKDDIEDEDDLREILGYYLDGEYEEELTLIEKGNRGAGVEGDVGYYYIKCIFENSNGKQYEFKYKIYGDSEDKSDMLEENQTYKVKFNVEKGLSDYYYTITDIEEI